jgi:DNA-binding response OmpR family regulator
MRVLILEDDVELAEEWRAHLATEGIEADLVTRASDGIALLAERRYDACVVDFVIRAPDGARRTADGSVRLLASVRTLRDPVARRMPVVGVSGLQMTGVDAASQMRALGCDHFLAKPLYAEALAAELRRLVAADAEGS